MVVNNIVLKKLIKINMIAQQRESDWKMSILISG